MLLIGGTYKAVNGELVKIGGRIKEYSPECPWVWGENGYWYDEKTGAFISTRTERVSGELRVIRERDSLAHPRSLTDHRLMGPDSATIEKILAAKQFMDESRFSDSAELKWMVDFISELPLDDGVDLAVESVQKFREAACEFLRIVGISEFQGLEIKMDDQNYSRIFLDGDRDKEQLHIYLPGGDLLEVEADIEQGQVRDLRILLPDVKSYSVRKGES